MSKSHEILILSTLFFNTKKYLKILYITFQYLQLYFLLETELTKFIIFENFVFRKNCTKSTGGFQITNKSPLEGQKQRGVLRVQRECSVFIFEMASSEPLQSIFSSVTVILFSFKNWRVSESVSNASCSVAELTAKVGRKLFQ